VYVHDIFPKMFMIEFALGLKGYRSGFVRYIATSKLEAIFNDKRSAFPWSFRAKRSHERDFLCIGLVNNGTRTNKMPQEGSGEVTASIHHNMPWAFVSIRNVKVICCETISFSEYVTDGV